MKRKIPVRYIADDNRGESRLYRWNLCQLLAKALNQSEKTTDEIKDLLNVETENLLNKKN